MPVLALNAGNMLFKKESFKPAQEEAARLTAELILAANEYLKYDAVNVGGYDLSLGIDYLLFKVGSSDPTYLSANLYDLHGERFFPATVMKEAGGRKVGIVGLLDNELKVDKVPAGHKLVVTDPIKEAKPLVAKLREQGADLVVVLTDMKGGALLKLARACPSIDIIIGSDKRNQVSLPVVEGTTHITHLDRGGKCAGRIDIFPAGGKGTAAARGDTVGRNVMSDNFVQLRLAIPDHPKVGPMVLEAKKRISDAQKGELAEGSKEPKETDCGTKFMGAASCKKCHADRYSRWSTTKHANAFQTLVDKHRQFDEECVVCHSLAAECDGGKLSLGSIESYNNVQCESCHGPGELHVASKGKQSMKPLPTAETCLKCHTPERSGEGGFQHRVDDICVKKS